MAIGIQDVAVSRVEFVDTVFVKSLSVHWRLSYNGMQELMMSDTVMLSVRIPAELAKRLDSVAGATERTRTYIAARAIADYVESEEETLAKIREGLAEADAGETVSHEEALRFVERLKGRARRRKK